MLRLSALAAGMMLSSATLTFAAGADHPNERVSRGTVTIITDGLAQSSGFVTSLASELAAAVDQEGSVRLLPIMGYGAEQNVRDMLYLRGIDLGILNSDVLPFLAIEGKLPDAKRRLRLVARLFDKRVFVLARADVADLAALAGKIVLAAGGDGEARITARTLFHLSGIDMTLRQQDADAGIAAVAAGEAAAIVLLARDATWLREHVPRDRGLRLLPLPFGQALAVAYEPARVEASELPGLAPAEGTATIKLASVLATFDWRDSHSRYGPVGHLIGALFSMVGSVRRSGTTGIWSEILPDADVPGWQRYAPALEMAKALPAAQIALLDEPAPELTEPISEAPLPATLEIAAIDMPALIGPALSGNGPLVEVLVAALQTGNQSAGSPRLRLEFMPRASIPADRAILPVIGGSCAASSATAAHCSGYLMTTPILTILNVLFTRPDSGFTFAADSDIAGHSICVSDAADIGSLLGEHADWLRQQLFTLIRRPTIEDCFAGVARGELDAVLANELEGRATLASLGILGEMEVLERPVSDSAMSLAIPASAPGAAALLAHINASLAASAASGRSASVLAAHLKPLYVEAGTN